MNYSKDHYSYRVYADSETARTFDSQRFGGSIGEQIRDAQERIVFATLPEVSGWKVLDVGAGTGRFTVPFLAGGAEVTACDASAEMLRVLQEKAHSSKLQTLVADAHQLQFPDLSYDCVISFRILMHVIDWKKALSEICRVSRDRVVFDFPPRRGFLALAPIWHRIQQPFRKNVQTYRTFPLSEVADELRRNGFEISTLDPGFFLPLVVYRVLHSSTLMRAAEKIFSATGLTSLFGSPVTLFARRTR